jgi:hypothetical protein
MKIETYKCDICGQICIQTKSIFIDAPSTISWIEVTVYNHRGNEIDLCPKHLIEALTKALSEDK